MRRDAVPSLLRRIVRRLRREVRRRLRPRPTLSVILPVYNVADYLEACLSSLTAQSLHDLEIIAIDDGSTDSSGDIVRRFARRDYRVRLYRQRNRGLGAARNSGLRRARGEFLTFVDSDDVIPHDAYQTLVAALRDDGSDIAVGSLSRLFTGRADEVPYWVRELHAVRRVTTVGEEPQLLRDFYPWNKVYRTAFWRAQGFRFIEGVLFEDQPLVTEALCLARSVSVLPERSYRWRVRDDGSSLTGTMYAPDAVRARRNAVERTHAALLRLKASQQVVDGWLWTLVEHHFPNYLSATARGGEEDTYRLVRELVADTVDVETVLRLPGVSASHRVLVCLALTASRDMVARFLEDGGRRETPEHEVVESEGRRLLALPFLRSSETTIPDEAFRLDPQQRRLIARLEGFAWEPGAGIRIAVSGRVSFSGTRPEVNVSLVDARGAEVLPLRFERTPAGRDATDSSATVGSALLGTDEIAALAVRHPGERVSVRLEALEDGQRFPGVLDRRAGGIAIVGGAGNGHAVVAAGWEPVRGLTFAVDHREIVAEDVAIVEGGCRVTLSTDAPGLGLRALVAHQGDARWESALAPLEDRRFAAEIDLGEMSQGSVLFSVLDDRGTGRDVYAPGFPIETASGEYRLSTTDAGRLRVHRG